MRLRLLGPVELADDHGGVIDVGSAKRRALLAVLGLEVNQVVSIERLLVVLWDDDPPPRARTALHGHVSALRKVLGPGMRLVTRDPGYVLIAEPSAVDVHEFRELVRVAAAGTDDAAAAGMLLTALRLWRGPALDGLVGRSLPESLAADLEETRREALVTFAGRLLAVGRGGEAVGRLRAAVETEPLHEPLVTALVLCLNQSGRQADALGVYHTSRRRLADELGIDPGPALRDAYQAVLRGTGPAGPAVAGPVPASGGPAKPVPVQLPRAPSGFAGRQGELGWLNGRLDDDWPVLVCGPAGVGKTALVLRWAHEVARRFPGGQLYASLRGFDPNGPADPGAVLAGFLRALGVPGAAIPAGTDERAALYRTRMAGRRGLVVLDDAASVDQIRPLLPGDARSLVVVTSRNRLTGLIAQDGAAVLALSAVSSGEALEMLGAAAGAAKVEADRGAALRLAQLCDHLPLALRVAAARLVTSPDLSLAALAGELRDEQQRLEVLSTDDADVGVAAALSLSFQALPEPPARLFTLLGLHPGHDIDAFAAAALAETTTAGARRALAALHGCHLVHQTAPGRYGSHDLIRLYEREIARELPPDQRRDALGRLYDYYLVATWNASQLINPHTVFSGHPAMTSPPEATPALADTASAFDWFDSEEKNIQALVTGTDRHEHAWRLAHNAYAVYDNASSKPEMEACMANGLRAARAAGSKQGTAYLLTCLGPCLASRGQSAQALDGLREAAELIGADPHPGVMYSLMTRLAEVEIAAGEWQQVRQHLDSALAAARTLGRPSVEASALNALAWSYLEQSAPERALPYSQAAVDLKTSLPGQDILLAAVRHTHSSVLEHLGRLDDALASYRLALGIAEACGSRWVAAACYHGLGTTLTRLGQRTEAEQNLRVAVDLYAMLGHPAEAEQVSADLDELLADVSSDR